MLSKIVITEITKIRANSSLLALTDLRRWVASMIFMQQLITASESLLLEASERAVGPLKDYFLTHLSEECGHHIWLARDLAEVGIDVYTTPLIRRAAELAGAQYYLIRHVNPACLLGYMAVLEGFPMPIETIVKLEKIHGVPLMRTIRYHAEHDLDHREDVFRMIDENPHPGILGNAICTALSINSFLKETE